MSTDQTTEKDSPSNPFMHWKFVASMALLVPVLLAGGLMAGYFVWQDTKNSPDTTVAACSRPASEDTDVSGAIPVDGSGADTAPHIPSTPYGPARIEDNVPVCFEHSPAGAAVAAATIAALTSNGQTTPALEELSLDTPARDAALELTPEIETVPEVPVRPTHVRVDDYTGDAATVTVVVDAEGTKVAGSFSVAWEGGDWRWDVPTKPVRGSAVPTLTGFNRLAWDEGADVNG